MNQVFSFIVSTTEDLHLLKVDYIQEEKLLTHLCQRNPNSSCATADVEYSALGAQLRPLSNGGIQNFCSLGVYLWNYVSNKSTSSQIVNVF